MIVVSPLSAVERVIETYQPSRLISLLSAEMMVDAPTGMAPDRHLKLSMHDISTEAEGHVAPAATDIERLIGFIDGWDRSAPLAIHCWAGISRSTAAAYVALCRLNPDRDEVALAARLRRASPHATPNRRIVALADEALGRNGRMIDAIRRIGRGADAWEGRVFTLPAAVRP